MKSVVFQQTGRVVAVQTQANVLQALLAEQVPVRMACGGKGICATCHVHVARGRNGLTPLTKKEARTLDLIGGTSECSRLACQAKVISDGVVIRLPEGLYVDRAADFEDLIGRRTQEPLLHPVDGRILVAVGKIMTRSALEHLRQAEADLQVLMRNSTEV
ncbi:MAG: 2Fe-2S iron-sulfur cluster-binding protein [Myxococcota bacterium]